MTQISKRWTTNEVDFLTSNYLTMSDQEMGNYLSRTKNAIERKRAKLKLKKNEKLDLNLIIIEEILSSKLTYQEIAEKYLITSEQHGAYFVNTILMVMLRKLKFGPLKKKII